MHNKSGHKWPLDLHNDKARKGNIRLSQTWDQCPILRILGLKQHLLKRSILAVLIAGGAPFARDGQTPILVPNHFPGCPEFSREFSHNSTPATRCIAGVSKRPQRENRYDCVFVPRQHVTGRTSLRSPNQYAD